jgi:hypothetical protein
MNQPENTCKWDTCIFRKKMKLKNRNECPNWLEMDWFNEEHKATRKTQDCAPVRTALQMQGILARIITLQQTDELARNTNNDLMGAVVKAIEVIQQHPDAQLSINLIPKQEEFPVLPQGEEPH